MYQSGSEFFCPEIFTPKNPTNSGQAYLTVRSNKHITISRNVNKKVNSHGHSPGPSWLKRCPAGPTPSTCLPFFCPSFMLPASALASSVAAVSVPHSRSSFQFLLSSLPLRSFPLLRKEGNSIHLEYVPHVPVSMHTDSK